MLSQKAKWIWINSSPQSNEYAVFEDKFIFNGEKVIFSIAAETDYILYINGKQAAFGQFAGYPFQKYCDEIDITPYCTVGENTFTVTVRYEGVNSATHINDGAGVIFSAEIDGKTAVYSNTNTKGGYDNRYIQHTTNKISTQLGLSSGMRSGGYVADSPCFEVEKTYNIKKRPIKKTELKEFIEAKPMGNGIYDSGVETTGYLYIKFRSDGPCKIKVAYGEHLADGNVRRLSGVNDFSLDFESGGGEQEFTQFFVRVAARYLEISSEENVEIIQIGIIPALYPLTEKPVNLSGLDKEIYDTCIRTLRLCMNTHYEDCPWREQALYVLDSRNQMLCGYYAFKETEFQRENLAFIVNGKREDNLLELTYPATNTPAIPFFSMMYPVSVYEYIKHTGDTTILSETMDTMLGIMNNFKSRIGENGLIAELEMPYWNFYEWSDGSENGKRTNHATPENYNLILNCGFVYSCTRFMELCKMANVDFYIDLSALKENIQKVFYNSENGLFFNNTNRKELYSQLGNAFALLIGLGDARTYEAIKCDKALIPATLSMAGYVYDALLEHDRENADFILNDIRKKYGYMLSKDATTFWETLDGESAFGGMGSLCHGWSAMPVYYYHKLGITN